MGEEGNIRRYEKLFKHVRGKWGDMLELDTSS